MKKKICIIGCNYGAKVIIKSVTLNYKKFNLIGISGQEIRGNTFKNIQYFCDWKLMIKNLKPDFTIIAVPPKIQTIIIKFLLKRNYNFMCEKPITFNLRNLRIIEKYYLISKSNSLVDLNFLTIPSIIKMKHILKKNIMNLNNLKLKWYINPSTSKYKTWKNNSLEGGGGMNNFFFHLISILNFWFSDNYDLKIIENNNNFYKFNFKNNKVNFHISFAINKYRNLFSFIMYNEKDKFHLLNKSLDYHNYYKIYKNNKIIYSKNFNRYNSRAFATSDVLKKYFDINTDQNFSLKNSISIQKKIFKLQNV